MYKFVNKPRPATTRRASQHLAGSEVDEAPLQRLGLWLTTNAGLPDDPSHSQVTVLLDALSKSSIPDTLDTLREMGLLKQREEG
jgi:hypothetical protein